MDSSSDSEEEGYGEAGGAALQQTNPKYDNPEREPLALLSFPF